MINVRGPETFVPVAPLHSATLGLGALDSMRAYFDFFRTAVATGDPDSAVAFMHERYPGHAAWPLSGVVVLALDLLQY